MCPIYLSEANGWVVHTILLTLWTGLFVDVSWNGAATKSQKPLLNFVEGIFDALTSYKRFWLTPFLHTPSVEPSFCTV